GGSDSLRPIGAADEAVLRGLHYFAAADDCGHRITVGDGFREDSHIGFHAVTQVSASRVHAPCGCHFIEHQNRADAISQLTDAFEKAGVGLVTANRLHHDGGQIGSVSPNNALDFASAVVVKWQ